MIARKLIRQDDFTSHFNSPIWASEYCETGASQVRSVMLTHVSRSLVETFVKNV